MKISDPEVFIGNKKVDCVDSPITFTFEFPKREIHTIKITKDKDIDNDEFIQFLNKTALSSLPKIFEYTDINNIVHKYEVIEIKEFKENESITFLASELIN